MVNVIDVMNREVPKIDDAEMVRPPLDRRLVTGKPIVVFNIILTEKTRALNTGQKIDYQGNIYEVLNRERIESPIGYTKFNCVRAGGTGGQVNE